MFTKVVFQNSIICGKAIGKLEQSKKLLFFQNIIENYSLENCNFVTSARVKGTLYKENYVIRIGKEFGKISSIGVDGENVYFLYYKLKARHYDFHLAACIIEPTDDPDIVNQNCLNNYHPSLINRLSDCLQYVNHCTTQRND